MGCGGGVDVAGAGEGDVSDVQLYLGDCLDFMRTLPAGSVDAVVTDPPYAIMGGGSSIAGKGIVEAFDTQFYEAWFREIATEIYRILTPSGAMWWTSDWRGAVTAERALARIGGYGANIRLAGVGVWDRGGLGMGYVLRKTYECFCVAVMPEWKRRKTDVADVWRLQWTPGDRENGHSSEKPVDLFTMALDLIGGDTVFDPFMGSGTTGVACVRTGRRFIGCEIDASYFEIAQRRIALAQLSPMLPGINGSEPKPEQLAMETEYA